MTLLAAVLAAFSASPAGAYGVSASVSPDTVAVGQAFSVILTVPSSCRYAKPPYGSSPLYRFVSQRAEDIKDGGLASAGGPVTPGRFKPTAGKRSVRLLFDFKALSPGVIELPSAALKCLDTTPQVPALVVRVSGAPTARPGGPAAEDDILGKKVSLQPLGASPAPAAPEPGPEPAPRPAAPIAAEQPAAAAPASRVDPIWLGLVASGILALLALLKFIASLRGEEPAAAPAATSVAAEAPRATQPPPPPPPPPAPVQAAAPVTSPSGKLILAGKYEMEGTLGEGGMGVVYRARDISLSRPVAVKKLRPELQASVRDQERFVQEARIISQLTHPYIVGIHEILVQDGETYLVLDYVNGRPLSAVIDERKRLSLKDTVHIFVQVCEAISFAHKNKVLHRDLKPSNIMVDTNGYAKVMDFGIARVIKDTVTRMTRSESGGTMAYMAPEQHLGTVGRPSDIYSLGVCLYESLTGLLPFMGPDFLAQKERMLFKPPTSVIPELPKQIDMLINATLAADPKKRVSDPMELVTLLKSCLPPETT